MLWQCLTESLYFFKNNVLALSAIILPIAIPVEIFSALYNHFLITDDSSYWLIALPYGVMLLAYPLYAVGVIYYMAAAINGEAMNTKTAWAWGFKFWVPYLLLTILVTTVVVLGIIAFIIPGLILAVRYAFCEFELLFNNRQPLDAIKTSWANTQKYFWPLFGGYFILATFLIAPLFVIGPMLEGEGLVNNVLGTGLNIVSTVLEMLFTIFAYRVYVIAKESESA